MIDPRLPLTDIHRHLDGNIRAQTILDLGRQFNLALPADELAALRPHVQITKTEPDLVSFLQKLDWGVAVLASLDACRRVAYENVEDAANAGLHYAELRFSPFYMAMKHQLPVAGVVEAVIDGVQSGCRDFDIDIRNLPLKLSEVIRGDDKSESARARIKELYSKYFITKRTPGSDNTPISESVQPGENIQSPSNEAAA